MLPRRLPALAELRPVGPVRGPFLAAWPHFLLPGDTDCFCTCTAVHCSPTCGHRHAIRVTPAADALILRLDAQIAIAATDLAEIIGSATALYLLFGLPVWAGVLITGVVSDLPIRTSISSPFMHSQDCRLSVQSVTAAPEW